MRVFPASIAAFTEPNAVVIAVPKDAGTSARGAESEKILLATLPRLVTPGFVKPRQHGSKTNKDFARSRRDILMLFPVETLL